MIFIFVHMDFWHSRNVNVDSLFFRGGEGGGSQKVYGLYTHKNVDIYYLYEHEIKIYD